jgi:hypothetical protein
VSLSFQTTNQNQENHYLSRSRTTNDNVRNQTAVMTFNLTYLL